MKKLISRKLQYYKSLPIAEKKEWNTLFIIYPLAYLFLLFYFLKYNYLYKVSEYNIYFLSLFIMLFLIALAGFISKKKKLAFLTYVFSLTLAVIFLTYVSGGIRAPGLIWLTVIGPVYGLFYGKKGIFLGASFSILLFIALYYLDTIGQVPTLVSQHSDYQHEKNSNYIAYLIFISSNFLAYAVANERATKELGEKNDEIEAFLRILFHDIANPLAVIMLSSDKMIKRNEFNEEGVLRIRKSVYNLKNQLDAVKKLQAVKEGKFHLDITEFQLELAINESIDLFSEKLYMKGIKVKKEFLTKNITVRVDYIVFINQIFSNIFSNSIKFSYPNSEIIISCSMDEQFVKIAIQDFGIGMSEEACKQLFESNKIHSRSGTNNESGSGYGLSIAKHFIESFNGSIQVFSNEKSDLNKDHGTVFTIVLPRYQD